MDWRVDEGDVTERLRDVPDNTYAGVLCDPPYGLAFMGKRWDYDVPSAALWSEVLRVCKPGAPLLAFGGTRTYHRMVVAIEDAGWEIRDQVCWLYGSGFPKSLNVSKALDKAAGAEREVVGPYVIPGSGGKTYRTDAPAQPAGNGSSFASGVRCPVITAPATDLARTWGGYGTALKPAHEPCVLARKPLDGTVAANVTKWGCGALAIDAGRVAATDKTPAPVGRYSRPSIGTVGHSGVRDGSKDHLGRHPANLILDEDAAAQLDAAVGDRPGMSGGGRHKPGAQTGMFGAIDGNPSHCRGDNGGPSRFFYTAKVSRKEREAGLAQLPTMSGAESVGRAEGSAGTRSPRAGAGRTASTVRNHHPTLKPLALTEYLARLILPPVPGALLVPFAGAGSEMIGAVRAGWQTVHGIEREPEYVTIAINRLEHWT